LKPAKAVRTEQEPAGTCRAAIIETEIDHILAAEEELIPSSGFLASVMERVQMEAAVPPPTPFPWARVLPGILLTAGVLAWAGFEAVHLGLPALGRPAVDSFILAPPHLSPVFAGSVESAGWVALALGVSLASWLFSRRLAGRGGLL
jgi:hypothetical protein